MTQGDVGLLNDPVAQELLNSTIPARLAYSWTDGTPRVVPVWFHWDGTHVVIGTPAGAPKLKALSVHPEVALTIDDNTFPHKVLLIRGEATVEMQPDVVAEYALSATRYFGPEQGPAWVAQLQGKPMGRIEISPNWVGILDFESRFPSTLSA
jgi:Pyridoxamine 5'-phosphate oxidase